MVFISELPVPDARIFFCSARIPTGPSFNFWTIFYVEGSSSPITGRDDEGNTYHSLPPDCSKRTVRIVFILTSCETGIFTARLNTQTHESWTEFFLEGGNAVF